ncbi:MAG: type IX secretion system plug protein domain-containing protein, partial [Daejeonella sp.]
MKKLLSCFLVLSFISCSAQKNPKTKRVVSTVPQQQIRYEDFTYIPEIKTVEFYNEIKEQSIPVYILGSTENLLFAFDDLRAGNRNISYTIEHCDFDWKSSRLSPIDY